MRWLLFICLFFTSACAEEVQVRSASGNSYLEVRLNDMLTMEMVIDTGASVVSLPEEIFQLLKSRGTISQADMLPNARVKLADGSVRPVRQFLLRKLQIGGTTLTRVPAVVTGRGGSLLLGQSALKLLPNWRLDLQRDLLTFGSQSPNLSGKVPDQLMVPLFYTRLQKARVELLQAEYEGRVQRKLPTRLLVLQETLDKLSQDCSAAESTVPEEWRTTFHQIVALIERCKSIASLRVRSFEGERVSERLAALEELYKADQQELERVRQKSALDEKQQLLMVTSDTLYPELKFTPGVPYYGAKLAMLDGEITVIWTYERSPAREAGLVPASKVVTLEGKPPANLPALERELRQPGPHRLGIRTPKGESLNVVVTTRKFVPFGARSVTRTMLVPRGNVSVTPAAESIFASALQQILEKQATKDHLVYVYLQPDQKEASASEILKKYTVDNIVFFDIESWQIATSNLIFVGKVRRCNCRVNLWVYGSTGEQLLRENYEAVVDELGSGPEPTFELCKLRLMEKVEAGLKGIFPAHGKR